MIQSTMRLSGSSQITAALKSVSANLAGKTLEKAVKAAGQVMLRAAKSAARKRHKSGKGTGNLARSMAIKQLTYANGVVYAAIGPSWPKGAHGWLVEHGHRIVTGGSDPSRGRKAPLESAGKQAHWKFLSGRGDRGQNKSGIGSIRKRQKALKQYLKDWRGAHAIPEGVNLRNMLQAHAKDAVRLGRLSDFLKGAIATGAGRLRSVGGRGHGKAGGRVPGYPFLQPAFDTIKTEMLSAIEQTVTNALASAG